MRNLRRRAVAAAIAVAGLLALPTTMADAAGKPANDLPGGAKVIGSLPFSDTSNTSNATTDQLEVNLNAQCGAPAVRKGVWYKAQVPAAGTEVRASAEGSSYSVGLMAVIKTGGNWQVINCAPFVLIGDVAMSVPAGTTVFILAFDDTPGSQGGTLKFNVRTATPAPTVQVTIKDKGRLKANGSVKVSGTASCQGTDAILIEVDANLSQAIPGGTVFGSQFLDLTVACGDTPINWTFDVPAFFVDPTDPNAPPPRLRFVKGPAEADVFAVAVNPDLAGFAEQHATITVVK